MDPAADPFDLNLWERALLARTQPEGVIYNATKAQKNFRYPPFTPVQLEPEEVYSTFRAFARPDDPPSVRIAPTFYQAALSWFDEMGLSAKHVGLVVPTPPEFLAAAKAKGSRVTFLSRDPEELLTAPLEQLDVILLSQPSRVDGFYYPDESFTDLIQKIHARSKALILCDESNSLFTLNEVPPGTLGRHPKNFVLKSLLPTLSPQGPETSWWYGPTGPHRGPERVSPPDLLPAVQAIMAFQSRQGAAFGEFQRKILLVEKGLRLFGDALKPALLKGDCRVPFWPESGFHLLIDISAPLARTGLSVRGYCERLAERDGILFNPGDAFGEPRAVQMCYAAMPKWLEDLGKALVEALSKDN